MIFLSEAEISNCEDYMRMEYGNEVADSVRDCVEFIRQSGFVEEVERLLEAQKKLLGVQIGE